MMFDNLSARKRFYLKQRKQQQF